MAQTAGINVNPLDLMDSVDGENYYTDLELAAAIGKNLLERNKELELLLGSTQEYADEQAQRSQYLSRQLEDAREVNESRVKLMEQIEKNHEQLSQSHARLRRETQSIQEHNEILTENLQSLIEKCDYYKTELEGLKRENAQLQRQLSSTQDPVQPTDETVVECCEIEKSEEKDLSVVIKELKCEQDLEKSMREELENELSQLIIENQRLEQKLRFFALANHSSLGEQQRVDESCSQVGKNKHEKGSTNESDIEEDEEGFNESFVLVESNDIEEINSEQSPSLEHCDISFLDEVDQQYRELVHKYNSLVEKCKSEGIPYASRELCMIQRGVQTSDERQEVVEKDGPAVPPYKKMFATIYKKIREGQTAS